jgi:hypothetical protein
LPLLAASACGGDEPGAQCGEKTEWLNGRCVPTLSCGAETELIDGFCVPTAEPIVCGPETVLENGSCVPAEEAVECGPGTVEVDSECVIADPLECGDKTVARNGRCIPLVDQPVHFPFGEGTMVKLSQTFHGYFSHKEKSAYAVDFPQDIGTPVHAARGGIVREIKEDSNTGCADPSCASDGNFVRIDHGDGTVGIYFHLDFEGAAVAAGEQVAQGQLIGYSGNTGFSSGPHLHFAVQDFYRQSLPLKFVELFDISGGIPFKGAELPSQNKLQSLPAEPYAPSNCPHDFFSHMGIELTAPFPCSIATRDTDYMLQGIRLTAERVKVGRKSPDGEWQYKCIEPNPDGSFQETVRWNSSAFSDTTYMMITAAKDNANCSSIQGWSSSPRLTLWPSP